MMTMYSHSSQYQTSPVASRSLARARGVLSSIPFLPWDEVLPARLPERSIHPLLGVPDVLVGLGILQRDVGVLGKCTVFSVDLSIYGESRNRHRYNGTLSSNSI